MKKTQVALAALALVASSAALAEVTISGGLDTSIVRGDSTTKMGGGGNWNIPVVVLSAKEDIGGGLKAAATLEGSFNAGNGQQENCGVCGGNSSLFNRQANISLGNEVATVTAGLQISPFINATLVGFAGAPANASFVPGIWILTGGNLAHVDGKLSSGGFWVPDAFRADFNVGGLTVSGMTRTKDNGGNSYTAAAVTGSLGGLNFGYGYQKSGSTSTVEDTGNPNLGVTNHVLSVSTGIGDVTVSGAIASMKNAVADTSATGYSISAFTPLAPSLSGGVIYSHSGLDAESFAKSQVGVSLKYDFSKATYMYFVHNNFSDTMAVTANSAPAGKKVSIIGLGTSF